MKKYPSTFETFLQQHHRKFLMGILFFAVMVKGIALFQYRASPLPAFQNWDQSDMNFFAAWADSIAAGDIWTDQSMRPYHRWHQKVAQVAFEKHPNLAKQIVGNLPADLSEIERNQALWDVLLNEKQFYQDPIYPYFLALNFKLFGRNILWIQIWQFLMGLCIVLLIYGISRQLFDSTTALLAALVAVTYPTFVVYELVLLRAITNTMIGLLLVYTLAKVLKEPRAIGFLLWGILQGIALMQKSVFLLFLGYTYLLLMVLYWQKWKHLAKYLGYISMGVFVGLLPLIIRNIVVGLAPFTLSSLGGNAFCFSNHLGYEIFTMGNAEIAALPLLQSKAQTFAAIFATLETYPNIGEFVLLLFKKFASIWYWYESPNNINFYYFQEHLPILQYFPSRFWWIAPLGIVGLFVAFIKNKSSRFHPIYGLLLVHITLMTVFFIHARLRLPLVAALIPFAAFMAMYVIRNLLNRNFQIGYLLGLVILIGIFANRPLPKNQTKIRVEDFVVAYDNYYRPIVHQALMDKKAIFAKNTLEQFLEERPEFIDKVEAGKRANSTFEKEIAWLYSSVYAIYGHLWKEMDRLDLQEKYLEKAKLLQEFGTN